MCTACSRTLTPPCTVELAGELESRTLSPFTPSSTAKPAWPLSGASSKNSSASKGPPFGGAHMTHMTLDPGSMHVRNVGRNAKWFRAHYTLVTSPGRAVMSEPSSTRRLSSQTVWTWSLAIACLIAGALFFPTPFPLGVPFVSLALLILAPRLPWARAKFIHLVASYPKIFAWILQNPPRWIEHHLVAAGITLPSVQTRPAGSSPPSGDSIARATDPAHRPTPSTEAPP